MLPAPKLAEIGQRVDQAVLDVSAAWFPANRNRLHEIQTRLRAGKYPDDAVELIGDIQKDFALFTYCLRELLLQAKELDESLPEISSPVDILYWGGLPRLRPLLLVEERQISHHLLTEASSLQAERFLEAMTSATTAELLAEKEGVNQNLAFTAALFRQLGYLLIAWNYPDAYERASALVKTTGRFDTALTQVIGFPPNLLALSLARLWGLPEELCTIVSQSNAVLPTNHAALPRRTTTERVAYLCMIGEALARANVPNQYPSAPEDWEFARVGIRDSLGPNGLKQISDSLSEGYLKDFPALEDRQVSLDPASHGNAYAAEETLRLNPSIANCPARLRREIEGLYQAILNHRDVRTILERFVKDVIPVSPWSGGCIYTIDPKQNRLVARTRFGKIFSNLTGNLDYLPYSNDTDLINRALRAREPLLDQQMIEGQQFVLLFAGAVGSDEPVGVFYAEAPATVDEKIRAEGGELLGTFRATAKALTDCLEMSRVE